MTNHANTRQQVMSLIADPYDSKLHLIVTHHPHALDHHPIPNVAIFDLIATQIKKQCNNDSPPLMV
jgi:hypothetical protein